MTNSNDENVPTQTGMLFVKYTGAYSGTYDFKISGKNGPLLANDHTLCVAVEIVDFYPKSGSMRGGTLLKVYGNQFVNKEGYNIVKIGHTIGSTVDQYCYVEEVWNDAVVQDPELGITYNSWLTCRIAIDYGRTQHSAEVILYASTFEEAANV